MPATFTLNSVDALNLLLQTVYRSLPMYMGEASHPWTHRGDERAAEALGNIVADQKAFAARIAEFILERGPLEYGTYPMEYTDTHFLSLDYLVEQLVAAQKRAISRVEKIVAALKVDPEARELAEEALGAERAHLEMLQELAIANAKA